AVPNMLLVHYNDLLKDLEGETGRIAEYLGIDLQPGMLSSIAQLVTFASMKQNAEQILPGAKDIWKGGPQTFIHQGTNGRWRSVLTDAELELYQAAVARELTPDCSQWLENGSLQGPQGRGFTS